MKVYPVESVDNGHRFDPQLVKYKFQRKINYHMSVMQNQRKLLGRSTNLSALSSCKVKVVCSSKVLKLPDEKLSIFNKEHVTAAELLSHVDIAMRLQQNTSETAIATNREYNLQLLFIFLEAFISFLFNLYYMTCVISTPEVFKLPQDESIIYLLQHLIQPCLCISVPVVGFTLVQYKFLAFSQQIQTNIPRFTIFGFFPLDGSVIFSMISATTTYLIILVQNVGNPTELGLSLGSNVNDSTSL